MSHDENNYMMSDFLFARPSFLAGFGSIIDWSDSLREFNRSANPTIANCIAIRSDWRAVGSDIQTALEQYKSESALSEQPR